jgi:hypothetical protein
MAPPTSRVGPSLSTRTRMYARGNEYLLAWFAGLGIWPAELPCVPRSERAGGREENGLNLLGEANCHPSAGAPIGGFAW